MKQYCPYADRHTSHSFFFQFKGADGKVEESMALLNEVENLKAQKKIAEVNDAAFGCSSKEEQQSHHVRDGNGFIFFVEYSKIP